MANVIQIKRGANANLPVLAAGELAFSTDTYQVHIGDGTNNHEIIVADKYSAQSILAAITAANPTPISIAEQTVLGRLTAGNIAALTGADLWTILTGQAAADVSMNGYKLTNVADPTSAQDVTTKTYVDTLVSHGLTFHEAVKDKDATYPISSAPAWAASTSYAVGDLVEPTTANGYFYKCTTAGTSGSSEPTWGTAIGGTTADGGAVWTCYILIAAPASGDRYWIGGTGEGDWTGHDYEIAQYNGTAWDFEAVTDGDAAYVTDENIVYFYDGDTASLKKLYTAIGNHAATHIVGGSDVIDGNKLYISWVPSTYTPSTTPAEVDSTTDLTAHLAGIDDWAYNHNAADTGVHGAGTNTLLNSGSVIDGGTF